MANNGIMTLDDLISGGILRSSLAADILKASVERAILNNPAIVRTFTGGDLEYKLGFMSATAVEEGVPEGQAVAIETPEFSSLSVPLSKDVVNVAITDEARIRSQSSGYDLISIIQQDASDRLSAIINKKIARALDTTPQAGTSFNIRSTSIYNAIAEAESKMPDGAGITAIVCSRQAKVEIMNNLNKVVYGGATPGAPATGDVIPGLNIPVFGSAAVETVDADSIYFVSNEVPGVAWFPGQVKTEFGREIKNGLDLFKISSWSAAKSNLKQTSSSYNLGVVETTWTTS